MSETILPVSTMETSLGPHPDIERLYDNVMAVLPAITVPLLRLAAWNCVEEFCIRGLYFRSWIEWAMAPGVNSVNFNPHSATELVAWVIDVDGLVHYHVVPPGILVDDTNPTANRQGRAWLALRPVSFEVVTDPPFGVELWSTWFETMLDGTLFRLYGMPAKPWSSPQLAQYHGTRFRQGVNRARDIADRLHTNQQAPSRRYPLFARGRRKN